MCVFVLAAQPDNNDDYVRDAKRNRRSNENEISFVFEWNEGNEYISRLRFTISFAQSFSFSIHARTFAFVHRSQRDTIDHWRNIKAVAIAETGSLFVYPEMSHFVA